MSADSLNNFIIQIASWARQAIDQGRSPFRRVETFLPLLTSQGEMLAPLVFWINRDSFMAGGLLLFPRRGAELSQQQGTCMAEALGLQHFVEWTEQRIAIWKIKSGMAVLDSSLSLDEVETNKVSSFQQLLDRTLDKLKYLSVMASLPPENLSPSYLANLCRLALHDTRPLLEAENRMAQDGFKNQDSATTASAKGYLTVLRLLALTSLDLLPNAIHPEGLERALRFSLPEVPDVLRVRLELEIAGNGISLPNEAAVRFHHLLRRLQQLGMHNSFRRTCDCLNLLLSRDGAELSGTPESDTGVEEFRHPVLSVNQATAPTARPEMIEIAPEPLLAIKALIRYLENWPHPALQSHDLFTLHLPQLPASVNGTLHREESPNRRQRKHCEAALRISWPTRRFSIPQTAPVWLYECLHLLGLCQVDGRLRLNVPASWLDSNWGEQLWSLMCQGFILARMTLNQNGSTTLVLTRGSRNADATILHGVASYRCQWAELRRQSRSFLLACLKLPEPWLNLLATQELKSCSETEALEAYPGALNFFFRHQPGRGLAENCGIRPDDLTVHQLVISLVELGIPVPAEERLARLETMLMQDFSSTADNSATIAERLSWLGNDFAQLPELQTEHGISPRAAQKRARIPRNLGPVLTQEIFIDGIPNFPEQYLYDFYRPDLTHYSWQGDLNYSQPFFDQIVLHDSAGQQIEIFGESRAAGLWLTAKLNRTTVDYPSDPKICDAILSHYLQDLLRLRQALAKKVHERLTHPKQAENLIRKLWNEQPLPVWEVIETITALFPKQFDVQ